MRDGHTPEIDEVMDRIDRGIAAVTNERVRGLRKVFRYMEKCGCVSIGAVGTTSRTPYYKNKNFSN